MFDRRATEEQEYLDRPDFDPVLARRSYELMARVNRWFGGMRALRRLVARESPPAGSGRTLRVLDIGAGLCDIPLAVAQWASRHGRAVEFTCLEPNPSAVAAARARLEQAGNLPVRLLAEDVWEHHPERPYDWAAGSMFFHHLDDERIVALILRLRTFVRAGVVVNDLWRSGPHYAAAKVVTAPLPGPIRHDALLSIRRGFRPGELRRLLRGVDGAAVSVRLGWAFRVVTTVRFAPAAPAESPEERQP